MRKIEFLPHESASPDSTHELESFTDTLVSVCTQNLGGGASGGRGGGGGGGGGGEGRGRSDLVSSNSSLMWDQDEGRGGRPCTLWQANI